MTIFIDSNEPRKVKNAFGEHAIDIPLNGYDFEIYTESGLVCIERKRIPGDFLGSVTDGRLYKQILSMRESSSIAILLLEGKFRYTKEGILVQGRRRTRWNRKGINNLLRSIRWVEGIDIERSSGLDETVDTVLQIEEYFDKIDHLSLKSRPRIQTNWIVPSYGERIIHFYNGLPGVGINGAKKIYDKFPSPMQLYSASVEEIMEVPRIGRALATGIYNFLRG